MSGDGNADVHTLNLQPVQSPSAVFRSSPVYSPAKPAAKAKSCINTRALSELSAYKLINHKKDQKLQERTQRY
ncbi:hypothetical protein PHYPO_G00217460 [Pangasianodon hypophthalmus]|uniref:Uncharacterized protein n=1 Tax=Pangasianodon hypophthalmus TaxID=310915 RepID=A0A5N5P5Q9_PANHP|nr:hypothetical protein PHYPO_G00217460 [Pangasianodon hypophthalmus]